MSCRTSGIVRSFACSNGASRDLLRFGEDIFGQISGDEITGEWDVTWIVMEVGGDLVGGTNFPDLQTKMEYTGSRQ
jgi:hypothetical protein